MQIDKIMIELPEYNPCKEYIDNLKHLLQNEKLPENNISIKYDNKVFITNVKEKDLTNNIDLDAELSEKGFVTIKPKYDFFVNGIKECPRVENKITGDIYLDGILKRMFSQIEFGFYNSESIDKSSCEVCHNIFKAIYANSTSIKKKNIDEAIKRYNEAQKNGFLSKSVINGIIYAVYDYYNYCLLKK